MGIFDPAIGGDPLLFQHLFWFYSHPAVYIMILPGMGVISELITAFSRKKIFGYSFVAFSSLGIAIISFVVWGHHMFVTGQSLYAGLVFSVLSFVVAIPSAVKVFNWTATLYKGSISYEAPMLYALGFHRPLHDGRIDGIVPRVACHGRPPERHLLHRRPLPLHHGGRRRDGLSGGHSLLVAEDYGPAVSRFVGAFRGADYFHRIQPDVLPAIRAGISRACRGDTASIPRNSRC